MGFVVYFSGDVQEILETVPDERALVAAKPFAEGGVDFGDTAVCPRGEIAAGSIVEQILKIVDCRPAMISKDALNQADLPGKPSSRKWFPQAR